MHPPFSLHQQFHESHRSYQFSDSYDGVVAVVLVLVVLEVLESRACQHRKNDNDDPFQLCVLLFGKEFDNASILPRTSQSGVEILSS